MFKKIVIGVCGLILVSAFAISACADQSIGYQDYFKKGVKAFREHDDQKALRFFKIAQIYDPNDRDLKNYLAILKQRGVVLYLPPPQLPLELSIGFKYYFSGGVRAFEDHNDKKAIRYFKIALIFNPASKESVEFLKILYRRQGLGIYHETMLAQANGEARQLSTENAQAAAPLESYGKANGQPSQQTQTTANVSVPAPTGTSSAEVNAQSQQPPAAISQPSSSVSSSSANTQVQPYAVSVPVRRKIAVEPHPETYIKEQEPKKPVNLSLSQMTNNGQIKPILQIVLHSSVIIEGKDIQKFLVVDEGFIGVKILDPDHIKVEALKIGATFLHIWDGFGRHTIYVEVVFPKSVTAGGEGLNGIEHGQPFRGIYSNDWDSYYYGKNIPSLKRQSYEFQQSLGITGETPYGFFDTFGHYTDFNSISQFDTYTIGLSQIPIEGTSNFNLRGFDALRYMSPLTMPGTQLRGVFADVDLWGDNLGISASHGQEQEPLGFFSNGQNLYNNNYVDAAKLILFPKSTTDRYSFNFATGYGSDRQSYLSDHVYSIDGVHKLNGNLTLNGELATDSSHDASLAGLKYQNGTFTSGLHFRDIDKSYSTISTLPDYEGELGADWTTQGDFKEFSENTFVEAYQDRLDSNPNDPHAFNFDGNGQIEAKITKDFWSDTDMNFVDTPGELSPQREFQLNERLSKSFGVWGGRKASVFGGTGFQYSHTQDSDISDYTREDVIAGIQLPLTNHLSSFANYEYDWLDQTRLGENSNPNVINAGFSYQKQINPKLSFTSQLTYRDELGVTQVDNFLSGEESVMVSGSLAYNPTPDISFFGDVQTSKVMYHNTGSSSVPYDDFEVHVGMRINFGGATYWDPLGTVSGIVFKDRSGNGKFGPGDEGIAGVKVKVGNKEATTDKDGRYRIEIRGKWVYVTPDLDTLPGGLIFSTPQSLKIEIIQGRTGHADFGLGSQTGIYGIVFIDNKGTGSPIEGDQFIGKVKVILDGKVIEKSDQHGAFYFRNVSPGEHIISVDINTLALDMVPLVKLKNKIEVEEGTNYLFNIPVQIKKIEGDQK